MEPWQFAATVVATAVGTVSIVRMIGAGTWNMSKRVTSIEMGLLGVQGELKRLGDVLVVLADLRGELKVMNLRIETNAKDIRDLQHGEGYVFPLNKSSYEKP